VDPVPVIRCHFKGGDITVALLIHHKIGKVIAADAAGSSNVDQPKIPFGWPDRSRRGRLLRPLLAAMEQQEEDEKGWIR
jgi:hypothetical protein